MVAGETSGFDITPERLLPDLLLAHPEARTVFDRYGLRGCGGRLGPYETIRFFAQVHGVDERRLLDELERAISAPPSHRAGAGTDQGAPNLADTIYRRYFLGGIVVALTAGATWGAWLLGMIASSGSFQGVSISSVNAHGEAQIFGWVGLFIMGFAYQAFPRLWQTTLAVPRLAASTFVLSIAGLIVRTTAIATGQAWSLSPAVALVGGALQLAAVLTFAAQILATFLRSRARFEPYIGFVLAALAWFVVSTAFSMWHTWNVMTVRSVEALIWYVATFQSPLRDLQIHGLALFMILGVSMRMLPALYDVPRVPERRAWLALALTGTAVVGEVALFLLARWTGNRGFTACLPLPWTMLALGCAMIVLRWRPWRPFPAHDRSAKFMRAAYAWLAIALSMLWLSPAYQYAYQHQGGARAVPFSHAYHGATRHAITVGFISLMIMGMAARVVPTLRGIDLNRLGALLGPFLLVNAGCLIRVVTQMLTDWIPRAYPLLGLSGALEVAGLAWWGLGLVGIIVRRADPADRTLGPRPEQIAGNHRVGDVLDWFPETEPVLLDWGFTAIRQPLLRRTIARQITLAQAAAIRGVSLGDLLVSLNRAIATNQRAPTPPQSVLPIIELGAKR
jgi:hypothetical protein